MTSTDIEAKMKDLRKALEEEAARVAGPLEASLNFGGQLGIEVYIKVDRNMDSVQVDVKRWIGSDSREKKSARAQFKLSDIPSTKAGDEPVLLVFRDFDADKARTRERCEDLT